MMNEIDLIQKHLAGKLPVSEQTAFNERLAADSLFQEKVSEYKIIQEGFRGLRTEAFENEIKTWNESDTKGPMRIASSNAESRPSAKLFSLRRIAVAASLILLLGVGIQQFFMTDPLQDILDKNHAFLKLDLESRGKNNADDLFTQKYLLAHDYLKSNEYEKATQTFDQLLKMPIDQDKYSKDIIHWKKILTLLTQYQLDGKQSTKNILQEEINRFLLVADKDNIYDDRAIKLKEHLD